MPLTKTGKKVMKGMVEQYGAKKGKEVFYASINKGVKGSSQWHKKKQTANNPMHTSMTTNTDPMHKMSDEDIMRIKKDCKYC